MGYPVLAEIHFVFITPNPVLDCISNLHSLVLMVVFIPVISESQSQSTSKASAAPLLSITFEITGM